MEIITRKEAKANGLNHYFTGLHCKHGHVDFRYTHNGECGECCRSRAIKKSRLFTEEQKEQKRKKDMERYNSIPFDEKTKMLAKNREFYNSLSKEERNKRRPPKTDYSIASQKQRSAKWYSENKERAKNLKEKYYKENKDFIYHLNAKRRSAKRKATVKWSNDKKIRQIYSYSISISKKTGIKHHVDHIVPLISEFVCGLHNEFNLQVITEEENLRKGNLFWPDMP